MDRKTYNPISDRWTLLLLCIVVFFSRLPFIRSGCGADEDAWGVALNIKEILHTGHYSVSRLPGYPVQDLLYFPFQKWAPISYNLINTLFSVLSVACFALSLKELGCKSHLKGAIVLAFTPIVYIASCNCMDYILALGFAMAALLLWLKEKPTASGILLGLAIGCRITSGALLVPLVILTWNKTPARSVIQFTLFSCITGLLAFSAVIYSYGWGFFRYYTPPQHVGLAKALYKSLPGVWGVTGLLGIVTAGAFTLVRPLQAKKLNAQQKNILLSSLSAIILYSIAYWQLPQEAGYLIPVVPFVILLAVVIFTEKAFGIFTLGILLAPWVCSISKSDAYGGASPSGFARIISISGQRTILDPITGPIVAEHQKCMNRQAFTDSIIKKLYTIKQPTVVICGWWYNELLFELNDKKNRDASSGIPIHNYFSVNPLPHVQLAYYLTPPDIKTYATMDYCIYYLPEQAYYNDIRYKQTFTSQLAKPF